jgi:hypothetical protein
VVFNDKPGRLLAKEAISIDPRKGRKIADERSLDVTKRSFCSCKSVEQMETWLYAEM